MQTRVGIGIDEAEELQTLHRVRVAAEPERAPQHRVGVLDAVQVLVHGTVAIREALEREARQEVELLHRRHQVAASSYFHYLQCKSFV